jgi:hypothetical protein
MRRSSEVLAKLVEMIDVDTARIRAESLGRRLDEKTARTVCEYTRSLSFADRNLADAEKAGAADAAAMTDDELDAAILSQAEEIRRRRGGPGTQ